MVKASLQLKHYREGDLSLQVSSTLDCLFCFFVFQGQKGERGSPGNNAGGVIKFSDAAEKCTASIAGTVSYNTSQKSLQLCDGSVWLPVLTVGKGYTADRPGRHCLDILNSGKLKL